MSRTGERAAEATFDTTVDGKLSGVHRSHQEADRRWRTATPSGSPRCQTPVRLRDHPRRRPRRVARRFRRQRRDPLRREPDPALCRGAAATSTSPRCARRGSTPRSRARAAGLTENLVAQVELACWDCLLAIGRVAIVERSRASPRPSSREVRERIAVGRIAEIEQAAAEAEVALRREALINARSARDSRG